MESEKIVSAHRQQILITGDAVEGRLRALQLLDGRNALWVSDNAPASVEALPVGRASTRLGNEVSWLVYDAHGGFSPNVFGVVTGMIRGGGGLLLLMPTEDSSTAGSRFIQRLYHCIHEDKHWDHNPQQISAEPIADRAVLISPTVDQQQAVDMICRVANGHRHRPAVLVADRGRGKSSALGLAAAKLITEGHQKILVTAPRRDAVAALYDHASQSLDVMQLRDCIQYVAVDALLAQPLKADLLLVDEAAGIPVALLEKLLQQYSRVVFATTVHGYEGAGQGFAIRFRPILDKHCRQWRQQHLQIPVRWSEADPLEQFVFNALLLDAEPAVVTQSHATNFQISFLDRDRLLGDEQQLRALFGLLVSAHYRTTPQDLLELLDSSDMGIIIAHEQDAVAGVLLYAREGGLDADLSVAISAGQRRVRGHLVPQVLAAQMGFAAAAELQIFRVVRIAVHADLRRRGIAGRLLAALHDHAQQWQVDMLGVSYGATPELLHFWQQSGYQSVRLGMRREASSGAHAALMLHSLSVTAKNMQAQMAQQFDQNWLPQLADSLRILDPAVVIALASGMYNVDPELSPHTINQLTAFAQGHRGYEDCLWALQQWLRGLLQSGQPPLDVSLLAALVQKILQARSWATAAQSLQLPGKAAAIDSFRTAVKQSL